MLVMHNQIVQSLEAYLTLNLEEGTVFGRIGAADGSVYLIRPNIEHEESHIWIKVKNEDVREEESDVIEVSCLDASYLKKYFFLHGDMTCRSPEMMRCWFLKMN